MPSNPWPGLQRPGIPHGILRQLDGPGRENPAFYSFVGDLVVDRFGDLGIAGFSRFIDVSGKRVTNLRLFDNAQCHAVAIQYHPKDKHQK